MQKGYFDQCNDIISNLEETLSALQLTVSDLHAWAFGRDQSEDDYQAEETSNAVPSRVMQNRLIDALEHATAILSDANEVQIFMMGGEHEGAPDDLVDDLQQSAQASPVKQAKPETLEAVEVARKIVSAQDRWRDRDVKAFTKGEACYIIDITSNDPVLSKVWDNNELFKELLIRGLVFKAKEKEAAIARAKALIAVSKVGG